MLSTPTGTVDLAPSSYASKNCGRFTESKVASEITSLWTSWMDINKGTRSVSAEYTALIIQYRVYHGEQAI